MSLFPPFGSVFRAVEYFSIFGYAVITNVFIGKLQHKTFSMTSPTIFASKLTFLTHVLLDQFGILDVANLRLHVAAAQIYIFGLRSSILAHQVRATRGFPGNRFGPGIFHEQFPRHNLPRFGYSEPKLHHYYKAILL